VQFSPDGDFLAVTERASQNIDIYPVDENGQAGALVVSRSSGAVPFGFAFDKRGRLVVSEAGGGQNGLSAASSYRIDDNGNLVVITGSAATNQGAACWVVITKNGRFAYTANAAAGSNSISGFAIGKNGSLTLITPDGRTGVAGNGPADMALSVNSQFLYVRNARDNSISAFAVQADGTLQALPGAAGLPAGAAGLAAF
jgi:6-phosphogluconolactonase (cycloisomerase 2 family)